MQPRKPTRQGGHLAGSLARRQLVFCPRHGLAERRRLSAQEREVAVKALHVVARRARALRSGLGQPGGLRDAIPRALELGRDRAALALASRALARQSGRVRGERFVTCEEGAVLVGETDLIALAKEMSALGFHPGRSCLGQRDPGARRVFLRHARRVGGLASLPRGLDRLLVDARAALPKTGELGGQSRQ